MNNPNNQKMDIVANMSFAASPTMSSFSYYSALLGLAETFRTMTPPNIRLAVHCLKSILHFKMPHNLAARACLHLGKLLLQHSKSDDQINMYLEKARALGSHLKSPDDGIKFEAADLLAEFLENRGKRKEAICVLNDAMRSSNGNSYWHCRLLLRLASTYVADKDVTNACEVLALGSEYAKTNGEPDYTKGLFLLSRCMLLLSLGRADVNNCLTVATHLISNFRGRECHRQALLIFHLVLQVSQLLLAGCPRAAKTALKELHRCIQQQQHPADDDVSGSGQNVPAAASQAASQFRWLPREYMVVLVYLISVQHAMQSGLVARSLRYVEKASTQMEKLAALEESGGTGSRVLSAFRLVVLEHSAMCRLVMGDKALAVRDIGCAVRLCAAVCGGGSEGHHSGQQSTAVAAVGGWQHRRAPQLHALLGLYAMSMNSMSAAEAQLRHCLRLLERSSGSCGSRGGVTACVVDGTQQQQLGQLAVFTMLNLALVHLRQPGRTPDCLALLERVSVEAPDTLQRCVALRAAHLYVHAFRAFVDRDYADAKTHLQAVLIATNAEDLNRLTAAGLMTLGQIFMNSGSSAGGPGGSMCHEPESPSLRESKVVIQPVIQLANKMPDIGIQLWLTALLKDVYQMYRDAPQETEWFQRHKAFSQTVISDHTSAVRHPDHQLIHWLEGPPPETGATTSILPISAGPLDPSLKQENPVASLLTA